MRQFKISRTEEYGEDRPQGTLVWASCDCPECIIPWYISYTPTS